MAQSQVYMTIKYALMVEVQKTLTRYHFKLQYDSRALSDEQADDVVELFDTVLNAMGETRTREFDELALKFTRSVEIVKKNVKCRSSG